VNRIYGGDLCTYSDTSRFYSYRRDGITGRMAALIWLDAQAASINTV
jgi:copper oxidase (laccase) domain-containing protein